MTKRDSGDPAGEEVRLPEQAIEIHHHYEFPTTRVAKLLDGVIARIGKLFSWLWLVVMLVILVSVISRYVFGQGSIVLEELSWYLYAVTWTVGLSYTLVVDDHVRVDVLHERFSLRGQAWVELLGLALLLLPFLAIGIYYGWPYFYNSFLEGETSQAPSGLPYRWLIKFFIPLSLALLAVAAVARISKCTALLFGWPRPLDQVGNHN